MRERVVKDGWYVYRREWVNFGELVGGQGKIYAATLNYPSLGASNLPRAAVVKKFKVRSWHFSRAQSSRPELAQVHARLPTVGRLLRQGPVVFDHAAVSWRFA